MRQHSWRITASVSMLPLILAVASLGACDARPSLKQGGPCNRSEVDGCGAKCASTADCARGLYCNEEARCDAECSMDTVDSDCSNQSMCTADGRCLAGDADNIDGGGGSSGSNGGSTGSSGSPNGSSSGDSGSNGTSVCADVSLKANITTPNVVLIVDQSGSMTATFDTGTRWTVLKDALLSDAGLVAELQNVVRFGIALYTYDEQLDATCPVLTPNGLTVSLNGLEAIRSVYMPAEPGDNTPTGEAVEAVLAEVNKLGLNSADATDPTIFILATDGNPDTCALPEQGGFGSKNSRIATARSIEALKRAYDQGIRTYVLAVAGEADLAQSHVNDLANAGVGDPAGPGVKSAPSYRVDNDQGLRDALRSIVTGELSCDVRLEGKVTGDACLGTVTLQGTAIPCSGDSGWSLIDESTIRLQGGACDALKQGQVLNASFPCNAVILQ